MFRPFTKMLSRFRREEDGALIIFGLILFLLMAMMGGLAVDLMRYENTRVKLQNTLDRSTLAAAALSQTLDREAVVRDYMLKAGLADQLAAVNVTESMNASAVQAVGRADTKPFFLHMLGIEEFDAVGRSKAEQAITNLEIVLVLDVSGSMSGQKIENLKVAAKTFVDTMMDNDPNHRVSIAIVPYNAQVNIGPDLVGKFNVTHHNNVADANCIEVPAAAFGALALPRNLELPMMAYADIANNTSKIDGFLAPTDNNAVARYGSAFCKPSTVNVVRLPNTDRDVLKAQIDALQAGGNTSITLGMKWGATMIDPSMRDAYSDLIADAKIPASVEGRPFAYDDEESMKIIVLMTDGEHVSHTRVNDAFKTGASPIYRSTGDGNYSVQHLVNRPAVAGANEYYVPHLNTWQSTPWDSGAGVVRQDWRDIWASLRMTYVAWQFYGRALGIDNGTRNARYNDAMTAMRSTWASVPAMDTSLDATCDLVKAQGVTVYGVTVEAPDNGKAVIASCATSTDLHYFEANAENVVATFQTIASNITMLKLTQ